VFQRCKPIFRNSELANTKSVGVPAKVFDSKNLSCSVSVKIEEGQGVISIGNLSENVLAVLPVKRVAIGKRGSNFDTVRFLEGNNLVPNTKRFVRTGDESIGFTFIDDDLEEDTIYEYSAILYGRSGNRQLASARFLEKKTSRTGLVDLEVKFHSRLQYKGKKTMLTRYLTRSLVTIDACSIQSLMNSKMHRT
jgi:hypothetical protein